LLREGSRFRIVLASAQTDMAVTYLRIGVLVLQLRLLDEEEDLQAVDLALAESAELPWVLNCVRDGRPAFTHRLHYISGNADDLMGVIPTWWSAAAKALPIATVRVRKVKGLHDVAIQRAIGLMGGQSSSSSSSSAPPPVLASTLAAEGSEAFSSSSSSASSSSSSSSSSSAAAAAAEGGRGRGGRFSDPDDDVAAPTQPIRGTAPGDGAAAATEAEAATAEGGVQLKVLNYPSTLPSIRDVITAQLLPVMRNRKSALGGAHIVRQVMNALSESPQDSDVWQNVSAPSEIQQIWDAAKESAANAAGVFTVVATSPLEQVPLIGRISSIGKIVHFGTIGQSNRLPFKFEFRLSDRTRTVEVTCWNGAAMKWHQALLSAGIGALVAVTNYRVRSNA
jgi:hypothetical protein